MFSRLLAALALAGAICCGTVGCSGDTKETQTSTGPQLHPLPPPGGPNGGNPGATAPTGGQSNTTQKSNSGPSAQ